MNKIDNFVESTLKVTASDELNVQIEQELQIENNSNKSIAEFLEDNNDEKK